MIRNVPYLQCVLGHLFVSCLWNFSLSMFIILFQWILLNYLQNTGKQSLDNQTWRRCGRGLLWADSKPLSLSPIQVWASLVRTDACLQAINKFALGTCSFPFYSCFSSWLGKYCRIRTLNTHTHFFIILATQHENILLTEMCIHAGETIGLFSSANPDVLRNHVHYQVKPSSPWLDLSCLTNCLKTNFMLTYWTMMVIIIITAIIEFLSFLWFLLLFRYNTLSHNSGSVLFCTLLFPFVRILFPISHFSF